MLRLKTMRTQAGISQAQFAKDMGVAQNTVSNWENENRTLDAETLSRVADYFHVSVDYLLGKTERREGGDLGVVSDEDIKFALFQGSGPVTDEMYAEVKRFAQFIQARQKEED